MIYHMNIISTDCDITTRITNESSNQHVCINFYCRNVNGHYLFYSYPNHLIFLLLFVRQSSMNREINYNLKHSR